jgi:hypothetical protein
MEKRYLLLFWLIFLLNLSLLGQSNNEHLLGKYLEKELKFFSNDTCFKGMYNIRFILSKDKQIQSFDFSRKLPMAYANKIKELLYNFFKMDTSVYFNQLVNKETIQIIQPILLDAIDAQCKTRPFMFGLNWFTFKKDTIPQKYKNKQADWDDVATIMARQQAATDESFLEINEYYHNVSRKFDRTIILKPRKVEVNIKRTRKYIE